MRWVHVMTKVLVLNTGGPWPLPHWPRSLSLDRSLQRRAQSLPLTATPDQVPGFHLAFLSVSAGLFGPCHLVRKVEGTELPPGQGLYLPQGTGSGLPIRLVVWLPPQTGASGGAHSHSQLPSCEGCPAVLLAVPLWDSVWRA